MGCGSSKGAEVKQSTMGTVEAPPSNKTKVEVGKAEQNQEQSSQQQSQQGGGAASSSSSGDGNKENNEEAAKEGMNTDADLSVMGRKIESRGGSRDQSGAPQTPATDDDSRMTSAVSTRSAPSIMERPSSRGGRAFEISFDDGDSDARRPPRRLQKLQHSSRRRKGDLTLDQLQKKLEAAEKRKKEYEQRILDKISVDTKRPAHKREEKTEQQTKHIEQKVEKKVDKAMENREAHLRSLREKLRQREEHGRKVREKKQQQAAQEQSEA